MREPVVMDAMALTRHRCIQTMQQEATVAPELETGDDVGPARRDCQTDSR